MNNQTQIILNLLDTFNLNEKQRDFVCKCDQFAIIDIFGNITSEEEANQVINEYID